MKFRILTILLTQMISFSAAANDTATVIQQINQDTTVTVAGSNNLVNIEQLGYQQLLTEIIGNNNELQILQSGSTHQSEILVNGNDIQTTVVQTGAANHQLLIDIVGDQHIVELVQSSNHPQTANVKLENAGGAWNFMLDQSSSVPTEYTIPDSAVSGVCYAAAGCTLAVFP